MPDLDSLLIILTEIESRWMHLEGDVLFRTSKVVVVLFVNSHGMRPFFLCSLRCYKIGRHSVTTKRQQQQGPIFHQEKQNFD